MSSTSSSLVIVALSASIACITIVASCARCASENAYVSFQPLGRGPGFSAPSMIARPSARRPRTLQPRTCSVVRSRGGGSSSSLSESELLHVGDDVWDTEMSPGGPEESDSSDSYWLLTIPTMGVVSYCQPPLLTWMFVIETSMSGLGRDDVEFLLIS